MEWIRKKCKCDEDIIIDLVDLEGQVKNLSARSKEYASEVVNGRETYVLIRVEKVAENKYHYTSLLNDLENTNPDLLGKLSTLSKPQPKMKGKKGKQIPKTPKSSRLESPSKRPGSSGDKKKK
ncbi:hypothetical protein FSP39_021928 [Pinctada imbricata]|uniref:Uncharacterized protein n=1 Tax=Pinctada imbricata TaxID=66713 RepID=A0AA88XI67_PINIB|nr:hypothetical protein FSP39_021928 [Pinctada imbricata]